MKKKLIPALATTGGKLGLIMSNAQTMMDIYAGATGAFVNIHYYNYFHAAESVDQTTEQTMIDEKNICRSCIKNKKSAEVKDALEQAVHPCLEMHSNAIKESHRFGGSYTYACPLGFLFWTSPVYSNGQITGALTGSGFLGIDSDESCRLMRSVCDNDASIACNEKELIEWICSFPRAEPRIIKAMAELLLVCAKSLSVGSDGCHEAINRRAQQQAALSVKIDDLKNELPPGVARPEYPLVKERELLESLQKADIESGKQILNDILAAIFFTNSDQFKYVQYRAMELAVLIFRADTSSGFSVDAALETNSHYIKSIYEAENIEELTDAMYHIFDDVASHIFSFHVVHHASALKKAECFILENFSRRISLEEIAKISGFSAPYFSTIFKDEMGENLSSYLNRLRVEKAGYMLTSTNYSLSKIARACGFEDQSWFSKIFKVYTGMNPGRYRTLGGKTSPRIPEVIFSQSMLKRNDTAPGISNVSSAVVKEG
ncbi:MAG: helix-turn-helix domain-containing protein [Treponema sp.]|nr:helix-turn-helix domain-containing protein [Treponema sp.]